ncbi:hypothetical protein V6N13_089937 [Hibiscus sabdariffa]
MCISSTKKRLHSSFSPSTNFPLIFHFHLRTTVKLRPVASGWSSSRLCVGGGGIFADLWRNHMNRHIASECTTKSLCWNCREPGHTANHCPNEGVCHTCGKSGHRARDCTASPMPPGDVRLCNNCYKPGHIAADCTNDQACKNCRRPGHLARDCTNDPICNLCNVAGHMARHCPRSNMVGDRSGGGRGGGYRDQRDIMCRNCHQLGHMSRDCMGPLMICHNCGGRGHMAYECPSGRYLDRYPRRY